MLEVAMIGDQHAQVMMRFRKAAIAALTGICVLAFAACSDRSPSRNSQDAGAATGSTSTAKEAPPPAPSWHSFNDPLTGKSSNKAEMSVALADYGLARLQAGCDRGEREMTITFSNTDGTPLKWTPMDGGPSSSDRLITSKGEAQDFTPARGDGDNTALLDLTPSRGTENATYGEVQDDGIPQKVEIALTNGQKPIIDIQNQDPVLINSLAR